MTPLPRMHERLENLLSEGERRDLDRQESVIRANLDGFLAVSKALAIVHDANLYRGTHPGDWDGYCWDTFGIKKNWADKLMRAGKLDEMMAGSANTRDGGPPPKPSNPSVALALLDVEERLRPAVWETCVAASTTGRPTVKLVRKIHAEYLAAEAPHCEEGQAQEQEDILAAQTAFDCEAEYQRWGKDWRWLVRFQKKLAGKAIADKGFAPGWKDCAKLVDGLAVVIPKKYRVLDKPKKETSEKRGA